MIVIHTHVTCIPYNHPVKINFYSKQISPLQAMARERWKNYFTHETGTFKPFDGDALNIFEKVTYKA